MCFEIHTHKVTITRINSKSAGLNKEVNLYEAINLTNLVGPQH